MIGKNNQYLKNTKEGTKVETYSIKKFKVGAASVVIGASIFFGAGAVAQASEEVSNNTTEDNTTNAGEREHITPAPVAVAQPVAAGTTIEDVAASVAAKVGAEPTKKEEGVALDKTKLEKYIKEVEAKFDKGAYANKTEESVALLKEELAAAKEVLQNATTQAELTKAYSKLATVANTKLVTKPTEKKVTPEVDTTNGQPTVGKKAENTEPKAGTNSIENTGSHDLRNGKAIDTNNPLRTGEQPAGSAEEVDDSYASYTFNVERKEDLKDQQGHSSLEFFTEAGDGNNRNNKSITFGEDENGKYMRWESTQPRGGGFKLKLDKELGEEYTIGVKFSYDKTTAGSDTQWRKIVDYKNNNDDTGFYFVDDGKLQFYNDSNSPTSKNSISNNQVVNFIIRKSKTNFTVYLANDEKHITQEFDSNNPATLTNSKPATITENGKAKTILGFFFDDTGTPREATPGGKVYSLSIYDKAVDPETVVKKLNKKTVNTPASKTVVEDPTSLKQDEKDKITAKIKEVNPNSTVNVGDNGDTTVTPDGGKTAKIPGKDLVKTKAEAAQPGAGDDVVTPASKVEVVNPNELKQDEKDKITAKIKEVNPGSTVEVDEKGNAKVTTTKDKTAVIPASALVKTAADASKPNAGDDVAIPSEKTEVLNPNELKQDEKDKITAKIKEVNPDAKAIFVDEKGNATVTTGEGVTEKTVVIPTSALTKKPQKPEAPTVTADEATATVTVTPKGDVDKVKVTYTPTDGSPEKTIEVVKEGEVWKEKSETPTAGVNVNPTTGVVTLDHTVAKDTTPVKAVATKGNSDASEAGTANDPVKQAKPAEAPTVTADEATATVTVTPKGDVDKVKVTYTPTDGSPEKTIEVVKEGEVWKEKSETPTAGVNVNPTTGVVTLDHTVAKDTTPVKAVATKGNSDASDEGTANDPVKQAKPAEAPTVTADEATATVTVTPKGDVDKVKVTFTPTNGTEETTIEIAKEDGVWKDKSNTPGVSVDGTSGVVTLDHTVAKDTTPVKAVATKGNSDASDEGTANDPVKQAKPAAAPTVTADEATATVTVTPKGDVDKVKVTYTPTDGSPEKIIEVVKEGEVWKEKSETPTAGVNVNPTTGVVTLDHTVAKDTTPVKAVATKGNSDASDEGTANDPVKQAKPAEAPTVTADEATATVTVTPKGDVDKVKVTYTPTNGTEETTIEIAKEDGVWKDKSNTPGVSVDGTSGVVTLDHTVAKDTTPVKAVATKGNSDASDEGTANDPVKQAKPAAAPTVTADEATATVTVTPKGDVDKVKVTYTPTDGSPEKTIEVVKEGEVWKEKSETPTAGVNVNPTTGVVTLDHTVAKDTTPVKAVATKGNSDASEAGTENDPVKQAKPAEAPTVTADEATATVTVTPKGDVDKVKVTYTPTDGSPEKTIEVVKEGEVWKEKSETPTAGVNVNPTTGVVTLDHTVAKDTTPVKAVATKGNSDASEAGTENDPVKQAKPAEAPTVTADEATATVTVTPKGDVDKVKVTFTPTNGTEETTIEIAKEDGVWKDKSNTPGVSVDGTSGVVTLDHTVAKDNTPVKAVATKGNSDASEAGTASDPAKQAKPAEAPTVTADEATATVTVTPKGDVDKVKVTYTPTNGTEETTIEIAKEDGVWKDKSNTPGVSVDGTSGVVTLDHTVAKDNTPVKAVATKGNSDASEAGTASDPAKQAKPAEAPTVTADEATATVTVTPKGDVDKVKVTFTPTNGTEETTIEIAKEDGVWKDKSNTPGVSVDGTSGVVTLDHTVAKDNTPVKAVATKGNSDASEAGTASDPAKQAKPAEAPTVTADEATATVTVTPKGDVDKVKVTYTPTDGSPEKTIEVVKEGEVWKEKSETPTAGVNVNPTTGVVTLDHTVAKDTTPVKAVATKGNSDASDEGTASDPAKQAKPAEAPTVTADEATATVTVTPKGDVDKVKVTFTPTNGTEETTIEIAKEDGVWKDKSNTPGVSVDGTSGVVTLDHTVAKDNTPVKAVATKGNSDASEAGTASDPAKQAKPAEAPTVTADEATATVTVTPKGDVDKVKVTYTPTNGTEETTIEIAKEDGVWKDKSNTPGVSVDGTSGVVTLDHTVAKDTTPVKAVATKGNSDASEAGTASDPVKPNVNTPASKTVVANPTALTKAETDAIKAKVEAVNSGSKVVVDEKGNATVTTPKGKTAVIPAADLTKKEATAEEPKAGDDVVNPASKTVVANPTALTKEETDAIKAKVEAVNPGSKVVVDEKGNATVTTPKGKTAVIPAADLTKKEATAEEPKAGDDVVNPASKTVVGNPEELQPKETDAIKAKVEAVNPGSKVVVDEKGNATVTTPKGKTAVIPVADLTKKEATAEEPKAGDDVVNPASKTVVGNPEELQPKETDAIKAKVEAVNPGSKVVVDEKGNATVTTPKGKTAVIPAADLTKKEATAEEPKAGDDVVNPASKTVVGNPEELQPKETDAIKAKVEAVNPGSKVVVDEKGNATVTTPKGKTAVIPAADLTKKEATAEEPKAGDDVVNPASKTVVGNPEELQPKETDAIKAKVEAVNPGSKVVVDEKGNATVTTPKGKTAVIPVADLTKKEATAEEPKAGDDVVNPASKTVVGNPEELQPKETDAIKAKVEAVNPGSKVVVDEKGNATVTTPKGKTAVIPAADLTKKEATAEEPKAGDDVVNPASKTVVGNPEELQPKETDAIKAKVEAVNPGSKVVVDEKGNATVTTPKGKTAVIPAADLTKKEATAEEPKAGDDVVNPASKTVVANPTALTKEETDAIKAKVEAVNPGSTVVLDEKGNATVTTPKGKTAVIPAVDLTKKEATAEEPKAGDDVVNPASKTVVANPTALTKEETDAIKAKVEAVNPGSKVVVDEKGNATVTTPKGKTAVIPAVDLTKKEATAEEPKAGDDVVNPASKTVVGNPEELQPKETDAIKAKVEAVNPGSKVVVDEKGNATVTTPKGKTAVIPAADLTKKEATAEEPKAGDDVVNPASKTVVGNPEELQPKETDAIKAKVEAVNPGSKVVVDEKGNATVTTPKGKTAVIPAADLTKKEATAEEPKAGDDVVNPASKTVVGNPEELQPKETDAIKAKVEAVNPGSTVVLDEKGNATVTTPKGKTAVIPAADLTKKEATAEEPKAGDDVVNPASKTVVANPTALTKAETDAIKAKVEAVNSGSKVVVDEKGNATVTTPKGKTAVIPAADLTKKEATAEEPKAGDDVVNPASKTVVANPTALTKEETDAIKAKVEAVNPDSTVVLDEKGNATVTTPKGKTAVIPGADLTKEDAKTNEPKAGDDVVNPASKTVVANPTALTKEETDAIKAKVEAVNPGSTVVLDEKGNATVTTPKGKTAVIPAADLTKKAATAEEPKAGDDVVNPASKTVVANPTALTKEETDAIKAKVEAVNPGSTVVLDEKGNATVTTSKGKTAVIPAADLTKKEATAEEPKAGDDVVNPASKTVVANPTALTKEETDAIKAKVEAVNPGSKVVVDEKGNATVTTPKGKTAVIPAADLTKKAATAEEPKAGDDVVNPASKTVVGNPEELQPKETDAIKAKVEAVNPGSKVVVDEKGNATVTTPKGKTAVIPAADLTKKEATAEEPKAGDDVVNPASKTVVANPTALTKEETDAIKAKVEAVNPGSKVVVDEKGNATVTTPKGKTAVIPAADLTKKADDLVKLNAGNNANTPASKTVIGKKDELTSDEKKEIEAKVKAVNPDADPTKPTNVVVDGKGNATVVKGDGTVLYIPASDLVIPNNNLAEKAESPKVKTPVLRTLVRDKGNLTNTEKELVTKSIKAVNPGATLVEDAKGNITVTLPNGSTETIAKEHLVKDEKDAKVKNGGNNLHINLNLDLSKVTVANLNNISKEDKDNFEFMMLGAITDIPTFDLSAYLKTQDAGRNTIYTSKNSSVKITIDKEGNATIEKDGKQEVAVKFDEKGNATIVTKEGKVLALAKEDAFKEKEKASTDESKINTPAKVPVINKQSLTDVEKESVKQAIIKENPQLKDAKITISDNGEATIVYPDGQRVEIPATDLVKAKETGNGSNGNTGNTDTNVDKSKLESGIQNLDRLIASELDKLDAAKAKEAKVLLAEAKEVFAKVNATQAEVDAMVKRLEEFKLNQASAGTDANSDSDVAGSNGQGVNTKLGQRLANTGTTETNTGLAGLGLAVLGGLLAAARRRKEK